MGVGWFLVGVGVGGVNVFLIRRSVAYVQPAAPPLSVLSRLLGGVAVRLGLAAGALFLALRQGVGMALLTFVGLGLSRWLLIARCYRSRRWKRSSRV